MSNEQFNLDTQTVKDMTGDVENAIAWGDSEDEFYSTDDAHSANPEFAAAADAEYERRTGQTPPEGSVAAAIYAQLHSPEGQADLAEQVQEVEEAEEELDSILGGDFDDEDDDLL
jgi:hypothetical protein